LAQRGDFAGSLKLLSRIVDSGRANPYDFNQAAWLSLFAGGVTAEAVERARKAVTLDGEKNHATLHTLATLYAETGKTEEARSALLQAIEAGPGGPSPEDWYVLGRIAEQYGVREAALADYARVTEPSESASPISTYRLAQRRITAIHGA